MHMRVCGGRNEQQKGGQFAVCYVEILESLFDFDIAFSQQRSTGCEREVWGHMRKEGSEVFCDGINSLFRIKVSINFVRRCVIFESLTLDGSCNRAP